MGNWTPSIVPSGDSEAVYLVADDFGDLGRCWRETDFEQTDLETVIVDLLKGQYSDPIRVICQSACKIARRITGYRLQHR